MIQQIAWRQQFAMHIVQDFQRNYKISTKGETMTVENLEKELKQGKLNNIYLFYGEELYLLENAIKNNYKKTTQN